MIATSQPTASSERSSNRLSIKEYAKQTGLSVSTVRRRVASGDLPSEQLGGKRRRILIPASTLERVQKSSGTSPISSGDPSESSVELAGRQVAVNLTGPSVGLVQKVATPYSHPENLEPRYSFAEVGGTWQVLKRVQGQRWCHLKSDPISKNSIEETLLRYHGGFCLTTCRRNDGVVVYHDELLTDVDAVRTLVHWDEAIPDDLKYIEAAILKFGSEAVVRVKPPIVWERSIPIRDLVVGTIAGSDVKVVFDISKSQPVLAQRKKPYVAEGDGNQLGESQTEVYRLEDGAFLKIHQAGIRDEDWPTLIFSHLTAIEVLEEFQRYGVQPPRSIIDLVVVVPLAALGHPTGDGKKTVISTPATPARKAVEDNEEVSSELRGVSIRDVVIGVRGTDAEDITREVRAWCNSKKITATPLGKCPRNGTAKLYEFSEILADAKKIF